MKSKYFKQYSSSEVFKIEGRSLITNQFPIISLDETKYIEITEEEYNDLVLRRTGQSTRMIDNFIQELFERGETIIVDHYETQSAHKDLFHRVMSRLISEHPSLMDKIEAKGFKIKFKC